jgi:hypothetical protein
VIERTVIRGNSVSEEEAALGPAPGGGIAHLDGTLDVVNSIVTQNQAEGVGGGMALFDGTVNLVNVEVSTNRADVGSTTLLPDVAGGELGAGIYLPGLPAVVLKNSIVSGNLREQPGQLIADECGPAALISGDYNRVQYLDQCVLAGQLAHVSTLVPTVAFDVMGFSTFVRLASDETIDEIPPANCVDAIGAPLVKDGRGYSRVTAGRGNPTNGYCEIGPVELPGWRDAAPAIGAELIENGGALGNELGIATFETDHELIHRAPYWRRTQGEAVQVAYDAVGGFPTAAQRPPGAGGHFFSGGLNARSEVSQTIGLYDAAAAIDSGTLSIEASGWFGGYLTDDDTATLTVDFLRNDFAMIQGSFSIGGFDAAARGNQTGLLRDSHRGLVPAGARFAVVTLVMQAADGAYNDGYADALSLVVPEPGAAAAAIAAVVSLASLGRRRRQLLARSLQSRAALAARDRASVLGERHGARWLSLGQSISSVRRTRRRSGSHTRICSG